jgi:hypothetical protein
MRLPLNHGDYVLIRHVGDVTRDCQQNFIPASLSPITNPSMMRYIILNCIAYSEDPLPPYENRDITFKS